MPSLIPLVAAVVAAPILKEWLEKSEASIPAAVTVSFSQLTRKFLVKGRPSGRVNSGLDDSWVGRTAMLALAPRGKGRSPFGPGR